MTGDNTDIKPGSSAVVTGKHPPQMFTLGGNLERWSAWFHMCIRGGGFPHPLGDRVDLLSVTP